MLVVEEELDEVLDEDELLVVLVEVELEDEVLELEEVVVTATV